MDTSTAPPGTSAPQRKRRWSATRWVGVVLAALLLINLVLGWYWSREPAAFAVIAPPQAVPGQVMTGTLIQVVNTLLDKPGGYLSNDILPHRLWLDNMPAWEFGVLVQVRDMARVLRRDMSRSQTQSREDPDLAVAEPQFNFDHKSWAIPATESEYRRGVDALERYLGRLMDPANDNARFYARADNLNYWLSEVQNRLGSLSLRLSNSVGRAHLDVDLDDGDGSGRIDRTPWLKIDDVFFEARGACWALIQLMQAAEIDFDEVLRRKNAQVSMRQMIRELEATQEAVWSPMILNGSGFGVLANHSLVMANYISRANAQLIDLRALLSQG
ncbi:hypothetical protein A167_02106 [Alcanivorax sp. S71-1-4]|uniref:DUF2333 family protein n=1 Tax=Alcanivorax sp. S71-1-4 TaxID=1177159 RepID=UPI00135ACE04|nr:DUF2333 family protein [Alcanivorax sp. S71-1-4]KAF0809044.1 hypothetical protein A167_02106 [Alcanivorax sp. S71-1-4]